MPGGSAASFRLGFLLRRLLLFLGLSSSPCAEFLMSRMSRAESVTCRLFRAAFIVRAECRGSLRARMKPDS